MRSYRFVTVDVFTERRFGGNPLAVFPDARGLSDAEMQALAAEFNLSETTFVLPPRDPANTARVRIFNRKHEMAFAGHPNVGTGYVLAQQGPETGGTLRFEEMAGLVEVTVERDAAGALAGTTIAAPQPLSLGTEISREAIADCAGIAPADVRTGAHPPLAASVGIPFVLAEVAPEALARAAPNLPAFRAAVARWPELAGRLSLYLYARGEERDSIRARMFAPLAGTWEDPATGSAATPLACLLLSLTTGERARFAIEQGVEMGRPSLLRVEAWRAPEGLRASVGGACVPVLSGEAQV
ncbi:MAG: PhzF family phenazine biosynthesis protein [Candidatus Odyssella sp.]|nr:PhzF family phenazine biosynthesis protein [Candidatus Odyssella sp.]